jgi:1,4-dihydroxy-2-naphthoate octaprenyltransferase
MRSALQKWSEILRTQNLSSERAMDGVSRWLLITRASVFPVTLTSGAIGGFLAAGRPDTHWGYFAMALFCLLLAHAATNMIADYLAVESGTSAEEYAQTHFAPHPIYAGLITKAGLLIAIAVAFLLGLVVLNYLTEARGWPVAAFALLGGMVSLGYVTSPLRFKHRGLGEVGVGLVWGPLMIAGTFFVTTGGLEPWVLVASLPYSLLVTAVFIGKNIDTIEVDARQGAQTVPLVLGVERALLLCQSLMVLFFVFVVFLILVGKIGVSGLVVFVALPQLLQTLRVYSQPRPDPAPEGHPVWPLWYGAWAFSLTRFAGALFVAGLILDMIYPIRLG